MHAIPLVRPFLFSIFHFNLYSFYYIDESVMTTLVSPSYCRLQFVVYRSYFLTFSFVHVRFMFSLFFASRSVCRLAFLSLVLVEAGRLYYVDVDIVRVPFDLSHKIIHMFIGQSIFESCGSSRSTLLGGRTLKVNRDQVPPSTFSRPKNTSR